jgi:hypothetical protein
VTVALASILVLATVGYGLQTHPARADSAARPMRQAVRLLEARDVDMDRVVAAHVWFFELSGVRVTAGDGLHSPWSRRPAPRRLPAGSIVVWDCFYSNRFGLRWSKLAASGLTALARLGGGRIVVLQRAQGRPPRREPCVRAP